MSIKEKIEYYGKECSGYIDIGTNIDSDDIPKARCVSLHVSLY